MLNMSEVEKELSASRKLIDDVKRSLDISSESYSEISSSVDRNGRFCKQDRLIHRGAVRFHEGDF